MTQRIYFKCYRCKNRFYGKTALSMWNGHLHCSGCIERLSKAAPEQQESGHYNVIYISRAGTRLGATLSASTFHSQEEAETYILKRKHAREILLTTYYER